MLKIKISIWALVVMFVQETNGQTPKYIQSNYKLVWEENFEETHIDTSKWDYRAVGTKRKFGTVLKENSYLDGRGYLIIQVTKNDSIYGVGQIGTQNKFLTRYGYFECRAKMNKEFGPHVAFWLQSPFIKEEKDKPQEYGTEIDIFEYHINEGVNNVYHNLHWNGYGKNHRQTGTKVEIDKLSEGFHTFGLEWTSEEYIFYVDGKETWRTNEAVSQIEEYIILSAELTGWGGNFNNSKFPDKVTFDYVKVYKKK